MANEKNWYRILGLEVNPPVYQKAVVEKAINDKSMEWNRQQNHPKHGAEYTEYLADLSRLTKKGICATLLAPVLENAKLGEGRINGVAKRRICTRNQWRQEIAQPMDMYVKFYKRFQEDDKSLQQACKTLNDKLKRSGKSSPYDFLNIRRSATEEELWEAMEKQRYAINHHGGANSGNVKGNEAIEICRDIESIMERLDGLQPYDDWCVYSYLKSLKKEHGSNIEKEKIQLAWEKLVSLMTPHGDEKKLLQEFCKKNGIDAQCVPCPSCGSLNYTSAVHCAECKVPMKGREEIEAKYHQAEEALGRLDFSESERFLDEALRKWPDIDKKGLKERLRKTKEELKPLLNQLEKAMRCHCYHKAKELYRELQNKARSYRNDRYKAEMDAGYENAKKFLNRARELDGRESRDFHSADEQAKACEKARQYCADFPGIDDFMPPPESVSGFRIAFKESRHSNILSWKPLESETSVEYIVVRSENHPVKHRQDGEEIWNGSTPFWEDSAILPGVSYYYNVFAKRGKKYSDGASGQPSFFSAQKNNFSVKGVSKKKDIRCQGNDVILSFYEDDIPKARTGFLVGYCFDGYLPDEPDMSMGKFYVLPKGDSHIIIENLAKKGTYYFSVWTEINQPGIGKIFSQPLKFTYDNSDAMELEPEVKYTYHLKKKFIVFGGPEKIRLTFKSEGGHLFQLPELEVKWQSGHKLLRREQGNVLGRVPKMDRTGNDMTAELLLPQELKEELAAGAETVHIGIFYDTNGKNCQLKSKAGKYQISTE